MGFGRRMGAFLGLVPDDARNAENYDGGYEGEYAEYADDYDYADEKAPYGGGYRSAGYAEDTYGDDYSRRSTREGAAGKSGRGFSADPVTQGALAVQPRVEPRPAPETATTTTSNRPVTVKLTGFSEARVIGEKYRDGQAVIMEMTDMADADARRLVDFAAGLAFARRGSIDKVATKVFMLLPPDVDVTAEERREYAGAYGSR